MIKLKSKINKSKILREMREIAWSRYEYSSEAAAKVDAYIEGVKEVIDRLRE